MSLLDVEDLQVCIKARYEKLAIVDGLSFQLEKGQCVGLVGESGSGKSTAALAIMGLLDDNNLETQGQVLLNGNDILRMPRKHRRKIQGRDIAMIFQDPMSSLNPVQTIGYQIVECIRAHSSISSTDAISKAIEMLDLVGMPEPAVIINRYPHQLSGGQRQRILIAMAIVFQPKLLIADEPTTALDLTIQAQILSLLKELTHDLDMALLLITHDLGVVSEMADKTIVLYSGKEVESGKSEQVLENPIHPYTRGLLAAHPSIDGNGAMIKGIPGSPPNISDRPSGCAFRNRCTIARNECSTTSPTPDQYGANPHRAACLFAGLREVGQI